MKCLRCPRGLALLAALAIISAAPPAAAQPAGKVHRVGIILTTSPVSEMAGPEPAHPAIRAFVHELLARGWEESKNLVLERRSAEGKFERFGEIVAELVRLKADVIVTVGNLMAQRARAVTSTVPIVMASSGDPVEAGIVRSLARPGGNVTGLTSDVGPEFEAKRLQLLKEPLPKASRIAFLGLARDWESGHGQGIRAAARALGVTLFPVESTPTRFGDAFAAIRRERPDAVFVAQSPPHWVHRQLIVDFITRSRLPSTHFYRDAVELGGLMSYGVDVYDLFRRAAGFVDKILRGAKPADLPVEQPTRFELAINLKTARALGLTVPQSLLLRADTLIE